jgi:transposase
MLRDLENSVRGLLRGFGLRVPPLLRARWADGVRSLIEGYSSLPMIFAPLLQARDALREQLANLDRQVRNAAREDLVCRRLMTEGVHFADRSKLSRIGRSPQSFKSLRCVASSTTGERDPALVLVVS